LSSPELISFTAYSFRHANKARSSEFGSESIGDAKLKLFEWRLVISLLLARAKFFWDEVYE